jgi:hypothetical protein
MWCCLYRVPALYLTVYSERRQQFPSLKYDIDCKPLNLHGQVPWKPAQRMSSENSPISRATLAQAFFSICR